tara:strand:+ start:402 stop:815 length:414 start_codon:yes stop_codon:yes gene_type:complete
MFKRFKNVFMTEKCCIRVYTKKINIFMDTQVSVATARRQLADGERRLEEGQLVGEATTRTAKVVSAGLQVYEKHLTGDEIAALAVANGLRFTLRGTDSTRVGGGAAALPTAGDLMPGGTISSDVAELLTFLNAPPPM